MEVILDAAEAALLEGGLAGLSIARLAHELHLAQNSIYWYFNDKDGLLVAVLQRASKRILVDLAAIGPRGPVEQVIAAVDRLADLGPIELAMRQRAPHAATVREFEETFDSSIRNLLRDVLRPLASGTRLDEIADVFQLIAIGALAAKTPQAKRRRLLRRTLVSLLDHK